MASVTTIRYGSLTSRVRHLSLELRVSLFLLLASCQRETPGSAAAEATTTTTVSSSRGPGFPCSWSQPRELARIESAELDEISGLSASPTHPGMLYVHNDSGDSPRFFAIDEQGRTVAVFTLPLDGWQDCEDIAVVTGPNHQALVYLGDIGDNAARTGVGVPRSEIRVHRFPEPTLPPDGATLRIERLETLRFRYPDRPHDAETLLVDPRTLELLIVTKENDGLSRIFRAPRPEPGNVITLELAGQLQFGQGLLPGNGQASGGDVSPSGDAVVIRTYSSAFLWQRAEGQTVSQALAGTPLKLPIPRQVQGESIGFSASGRGYYTVSEKTAQPLFAVDCR